MIDLVAVVAVLALCLILLPAAGWWLAARLSGSSLLRLTVACLAGVTTLAVAELLAYVFRLPQWMAIVLVLAACAAGARDLLATMRRGEFAWDALLTWGGASAILVGATAAFAVHGAPGAVWDWYEHWLRSLIFLQQGPVTTKIGMYTLPARGPLFNGAAAVILYLTGSAHYWVFQIVAIAFNMVVCLPFALVLETIGGLRRRWALLTAALVLVLVPFFFWNNTFTWTKDLTAAFVLMGIHSYFMAYRKGRRDEMGWALAYLAPGFFCHYLALLYAGLLGLHLLCTIPRREWLLPRPLAPGPRPPRGPLPALIQAGVVWGVLIGPWFGYLFLNFGIKRTLGANTTVGRYYVAEDAHGVPIPQYRVMAANLCTDLLPKSLCGPLLPPAGPLDCVWVEGGAAGIAESPGPCPAGFSWNGLYAVLRYSGLAALSIALLVLATTRSGWNTGEKRFLLWVLGAGVLLNLLPIRWFDPGGTFSENLQAWIMVLAAIVARGWSRLPRFPIAMLVLAMMAEYGTADVQSIRRQMIPLPLPNHQSAIEGNLPLGIVLPDPQSKGPFRSDGDYYKNYQFKVKGGALYYRDLHPDSYVWVTWTMLALGLLAIAAGQRRHSNI
jgi:hypothetical protein